jgi:uncharacterized SAM-binding protein YcdF (DUF218 family)
VIYVAKILPALLLPVGVVIILLAAGLGLRRRWLLVAGLVVLWSASTPLVGDLAMRAVEGWQVPVDVDSVPASDAIVVLTGMLQRAPGTREVYEWGGGVDRFEAGVALHRAGKARTVIIPGGWVPWRPDSRPEGEVLAEKAVALGVPREHLVVTERVSNTAGEAAAVARWLARDGTSPRRIILVTSAFHMRRARLIFERAGLSVVPYPVDFQTSDSPFAVLDALPTAAALRDTETALRELYGYLYYRVVR